MIVRSLQHQRAEIADAKLTLFVKYRYKKITGKDGILRTTIYKVFLGNGYLIGVYGSYGDSDDSAEEEVRAGVASFKSKEAAAVTKEAVPVAEENAAPAAVEAAAPPAEEEEVDTM